MRVVIADDSVLLREGLVRVVAEGGFDVVDHVGNADELLAAVRRDEPDVAIVDVRMPPTYTDEGARAAREIRERHPDVGVLGAQLAGPAQRGVREPREGQRTEGGVDSGGVDPARLDPLRHDGTLTRSTDQDRRAVRASPSTPPARRR